MLIEKAMNIINVFNMDRMINRTKKFVAPVTASIGAAAVMFVTVPCQAADSVDLPESLLKGHASGYVTALHSNIGPEMELVHVSKGMYTGSYKFGNDFYPFMGKIVNGKLKGTVTLPDDTLDFTLELDDRGLIHYLDEFPEDAREIRFSSEIEKCLYPLRWKAANESHTPYQKLRHFTTSLPGGAVMTFNWIPGDGKSIPDHWTCVTETTVNQWRAVMEGIIDGNMKPVDTRDRNAVMSFLAKLTEQERVAGRLPEGFVFTLPNATMWEYDCRAGTTGDINVDGAMLEEVAWFWDNSDKTEHSVCQKRSNAWGLYDMLGNAWEYVQEVNVFLGGSFFSYRADCKSSSKTSMRNCTCCGNGLFVQDEHTRFALRYPCDINSNWHRDCLNCHGFRVVLMPVK